jgi:hypothetical protein
MAAAGVSRRALVRGYLGRILAVPPPANHCDHLRVAAHGTRNHAAEERQLAQVRILRRLYGRDELAAAYAEWLYADLAEQAKAARPLRSWDDVPLDGAPIGWNRDVHGFLCPIACCDFSYWQVISVAGRERMCAGCARRVERLTPDQVWQPKLPPAHHHLACPGLLPGEPAENEIVAGLSDGSERRYGAGDAYPFLLADGWMGLAAAFYRLSGDPGRPRLEITGATAQEGHRFSFAAALDYDPSPQGWRRTPYGLRFASGTLTGPGGEARAFTDAFDLLDTIARGEQAFTTSSGQAARGCTSRATAPAPAP